MIYLNTLVLRHIAGQDRCLVASAVNDSLQRTTSLTDSGNSLIAPVENLMNELKANASRRTDNKPGFVCHVAKSFGGDEQSWSAGQVEIDRSLPLGSSPCPPFLPGAPIQFYSALKGY